jgi:hypothetical protein
VHIEIETGSPNVEVHYAELTCAPSVGLNCSGGSSTVDVREERPPIPPLHLGPIEEDKPAPDPDPVPPQLICTGGFTVRVGATLDEKNSHFCSIDGYPRPTMSYENLPPGMTVTRWPNPITDGWLVGQGRITTAGRWQVRVEARLPDWYDTKFVDVVATAG